MGVVGGRKMSKFLAARGTHAVPPVGKTLYIYLTSARKIWALFVSDIYIYIYIYIYIHIYIYIYITIYRDLKHYITIYRHHRHLDLLQHR